MRLNSTLPNQRVVLEGESHRYFLGTKELMGITGFINERLGLPKPSEFVDFTRGTAVHEDVELVCMGVPPATKEGEQFKKWLSDTGNEVMESEYIVTDSEKFASPIDIVTKSLKIIDIKTFPKFTSENLLKVKWQLSIYAYLLRKCAGSEASGASVLKLQQGSYEEKDIELFPHEEVERFLYDETANYSTMALIKEDENEDIERLYDFESRIVEMETEVKRMKEMRDAVKQAIISEMERTNTLKLESDRMVISYVKPSEKRTYDVKAFIEKYGDEQLKEFERTTSVSSTVRIKIK